MLSTPQLRRAAISMSLVLGCVLVGGSCNVPFEEYNVSVHVTGSGSGIGHITSEDDVLDLDCFVPYADRQGLERPSCNGAFFDAGSGGSIRLLAAPLPGSQLVAWTGCTETDGTRCRLDFDRARSFDVSARLDLVTGGIFARVSADGFGSVSIEGVPGGPRECAANRGLDGYYYPNCDIAFLAAVNGSFSLTATPDLPTDFHGAIVFAGWTGCPSASGNVCTISYLADTENSFGVTAHFVPTQIVSVTITGTGAGSGTINGPGVFDCPLPSDTSCSHAYDGALVTELVFRADPASGSVVGGWTGCSSVSNGDRLCHIAHPTGTAATYNVTVRFDLAFPVSVTVSGTGSGAGHVASTTTTTGLDVGINCDFPSGVTCAVSFPALEGGSFDLVASPTSGNAFTSWSGCPSASANVCTISYPPSMASEFAVAARFDLTTGALDTLTLYNGTSQIANMVVASELPAPSNSLGPSTTRKLMIPKAVGTVVAVRAFVGGAQVTSRTCTVTATAWQGDLKPLVGLFSEGAVYFLTCYNF